MKILLSPSKTLDFDTDAKFLNSTQPQFLPDSEELVKVMKGYSADDIKNLMKVSDKIAQLNFDRYQNFKTPFSNDNAKPCIFAFRGDVYDGLRAEEFEREDIEFAQEHLRILSGLYGLLKPMDLMQAYRLEMGTKLKNPRGKDLYAFWGDKITEEIGDDLVINLASNEYFKAVKPKNLINVEFKENKDGQLKIIGLFAKKARGMMARYIIQNKITNPEDIKSFDHSGYEFREELSDGTNFVFAR